MVEAVLAGCNPRRYLFVALIDSVSEGGQNLDAIPT